MPIYTKNGDKGKTKSFFGEMNKSDDLAEALGSVDELNSWVGFVRSQIPNRKLDNELKQIQNNLLIIGSSLAGSKKRLKGGEIMKLEKLIDKLTEELLPLKNFIYPVGELQVARTVCRRAERRVVALRSSKQILNSIKYLNRLSDALFTVARWVNYKTGIKEEVWK